MTLLLIWLGLCVAIGILAKIRGRDSLDWVSVSLVYSPLLAFLFLVVLPSEPRSFRPGFVQR
jgi:hypothetical protein